MSSSKNDKSKLVSILINDEQNDEDDENDDDSNERPLIEKKKISTKNKSLNMKKGYYELSKQDKEGPAELLETGNKIVNAVDYDDDEYEEDNEDDFKEEDNEQTQLTKNFHKKKKNTKHSDKRSIRKKLFGISRSGSKNLLKQQSSTDDEFGLGKIKILMPNKKKGKLFKYKIRKFIRNIFSLCCLLIILIIVFIMLFLKRQNLNQFLKDHLSSPSSSVKRNLEKESKHCDMLLINSYWNKSLPKLVVDAPLRLLNLNVNDNNLDNLDILVPFQTSIDQTKYNAVLCQIYFNQTESSEHGCGGGLLLLDGNTGDEKWRVYTRHKIDAVNCFIDLDDDKVMDCFATGPRAGFYTISGKNGRIIWWLNAQEQGEPFQPNAAFHTPLLLPKDVDSDDLNDILVMHGGDDSRLSKSATGRLFCLSSRTGSIISWAHVPDGQDRNQKQDLDTIEVVYGTGSYNSPGSLWSINLEEFLAKNSLKTSIKIYGDCCKGILSPPILIDLNKDHIKDIVVSLFNSTVVAFHGRTFVELWHTKFGQDTEFYVPPAVGFYDDDDIPDFLVQYELGDGFPNTYFSEVQILNGKNGKPMLSDSIKMLIGSKAAPITISIDTNDKTKSPNSTHDQTVDSFDLFLFWSISCDNQDQTLKKLKGNQKDDLKFRLQISSVNELRKTDLCKLRFDKSSLNRLNSISYGKVITTIYDSKEQASKELEHNNRFNYSQIGADNLAKNPELFVKYMNNFDQENDDDSNDNQYDLFSKRNRDSNFNNQNGFFLPGLTGLNDESNKQDYSSFKTRQNDYPFNIRQDLPNQQAFNMPSLSNLPNIPGLPNLANPSNQLNDYNQNNLANLLNQFQQQQQQQPKIPPPYNQGFDLNSMNILNRKRNRFVKKKYPFDMPDLDEQDDQVFRRDKRSAKDNEGEFTHVLYSTPTLAPSKLKHGIDLVFASSHIPVSPESKNVKLIKKSVYDCMQRAQKSKTGQLGLKGSSLNDLLKSCGDQMNKNEEPKKSTRDSIFRKQMASTTIYRTELKCKNDETKMKAYRYQIWPNYMGILGNGFANV